MLIISSVFLTRKLYEQRMRSKYYFLPKIKKLLKFCKSENVLNLYNILSNAVFMYRVHTKISRSVFTGSFQRISHLYSTTSSTWNFSKPKLELTETKYKISIRGPTIWNDFAKGCLKSTEKYSFFKVKIKSKLLHFDNEISYF